MADLSARRNFLKNVCAAAAVTLPTTTLAHAASANSEARTAHGSVFYSVLDFGAIGDGKTVCTKAMQIAVDACAAGGGGKVVVPAGRYLTGPIFLKSNIEFEVLAGARLLFTDDYKTIPAIRGLRKDDESYASLLTGLELENVSITGSGILDGQGEIWWKATRERSEREKRGGQMPGPAAAPLKWGRPRIIKLYRYKNVTIRGVTLMNSPPVDLRGRVSTAIRRCRAASGRPK
jgi:polygalacturonase